MWHTIKHNQGIREAKATEFEDIGDKLGQTEASSC